MKWSWRIARVAGIDVNIHATFLLLMGWLALTAWNAGRSVNAVVAGILFPLALFACVLLHEFGHALTARKYGISTRDITLLPIGGVARLERMPDQPLQEFWVALAGPAVNLVISALLVAWLALTGGLGQIGLNSASFVGRLLTVNVFLAVFNLIPAFPMDGGRVVRALLAMRMEYTRATQIAATLGQGIAFLLGFIGLFANPFLLFIALFVWIGAAQEASMVQMRSSLDGIPVNRAMLTQFNVLAPRDPVTHVVSLILAGSQHDFPVVDGDEQVVGILTRGDLISWLSTQGQSGMVEQVMKRDFEVVGPYEMLDRVSQRIQGMQLHTLPVVLQDRLVGLLTMENIGEFLMIQTALSEVAERRRTRAATN